MWKALSVTAVLGLIVAACGGTSEQLSVDAYARELQAVEVSFGADAPGPEVNPEEFSSYPGASDLVYANELYRGFDVRLSGWRSLTPPAELVEEHNQLVAALEEIQETVGKYLMDESFDPENFSFRDIGMQVGPLLRSAEAACRELRSSLDDLGERLSLIHI